MISQSISGRTLGDPHTLELLPVDEGALDWAWVKSSLRYITSNNCRLAGFKFENEHKRGSLFPRRLQPSSSPILMTPIGLTLPRSSTHSPRPRRRQRYARLRAPLPRQGGGNRKRTRLGTRPQPGQRPRLVHLPDDDDAADDDDRRHGRGAQDALQDGPGGRLEEGCLGGGRVRWREPRRRWW